MSVNVASDYFKNAKKIITDYMVTILDEKYNRKICNTLIESYMEARYYNYADDDSMNNMIASYLKDTIKNLDFEDKNYLSICESILNVMFYLDSDIDEEVLKNKVNVVNNIRIQKLGLNEKGFATKLFKIIKLNKNKREKYFNNFKTSDFNLEIDKTNINKVYNVYLTHNIKFNTLYSDYAIINAFNTGMVNEDRIGVSYYLFMKEAMKDIINGDFTNNYLLDFDPLLLGKNKKFNSTMNIIDSDPIKDITALKINYTDFNNNKNAIYDLKRDGYNFAVVIDSSYIDDDVNFTKLQMFKYVIIDKEEYKYESIVKMKNSVLL